MAPITHKLKLRISDDVVMEFNRIPAGTFRMGRRGCRSEEEPVHRVVIGQPFYLGVFPVTQAQYQRFRPDHENFFHGHPTRPVEQVDWNDARTFCRWLIETVEDLPAAHHVNLPTEAQWEYACRGGVEGLEYHSGDGEAALKLVGWFIGNARDRTHRVGGKPANGYGLHDMHGNVLEWCRDEMDWRAYARTPKGPIAKDDSQELEAASEDAPQVMRGGSWGLPAAYSCAAFRLWNGQADRNGNVGFRVGLFPGQFQ